ncbi:type I restriction enzyme S subunit [Halomonas campaniensis]|uniref:Type I restriction enzyme S subunit n=1 Tax=Halomonas campaniensis TaxID=213554 RepID=A0A7W5PA24_9GAMM|nr:restriction endonuclease subunit S [Halomonas campaniensis]MBB3330260.1 type I restriction enzyme S subunit [Halomonas campaniensis]
MSWPFKPLNELCLLAVDCVNKTAPVVDYDTGYRMIRTTNIKGGFIDLDNVRYVTEEVFEKWTRRSRPQYGDVILTREAPVGEVGRFTEDVNNVFLGQRLFHYRPDPELLDWNYLAYALQSRQVQGRLKGMGFGATVDHIRVGDAETLAIPCPTLPVQHSIGGILASYDDLIENNQRRIQLLEESARLLYKEWFAHLRFPGHEHVKVTHGVPEGWEPLPLGDLITLQRGFDLPVSKRVEGEVPIYASTGITGYHAEEKVSGPGVVTGRSGSLGQVMYVNSDYWPLNTTLWVKEFKKIRPHFARHLLAGLHLEQYNGGAAVPTLNRNDVHRIQVLLPPPTLLSLFEEQATDFYQQVDVLTKTNERLAKARDLLLPKLMSGELAA